ncbi:hypothetical protein N0V84_006689 [Fusarium piperis]|uniref:CoxI translation protein CYA5 n=1 Tax=Fusarium piperis TaxID=1435070 RepID=A0A9W8WBD8_9HYPO|nr:hypothetical protein N0V84_006689 [Fusarium piperis]
MLERTAASLETRSLQRVIRQSPTPKRSRQLHTGFWQHGASAIELASALPSSSRATDSEAVIQDITSRQLQPTLVASAFMLDFLYPTSTIPLLRQIYPKLPSSQAGQRTAVVTQRRPFSSEPPLSSAEGEDASAQPASTTSKNNEDKSELEQIQELLEEDEHRYQDVWDLYCGMDNDQRRPVRGLVVEYLSKSHGVVETGRAVSVFRQIPSEEWTESLLTAGIILLLRAGDMPSAMGYFRKGLQDTGFSNGLEYLIADAMSSQKWGEALEVWITYCEEQRKKSPEVSLSTERLQQLATLPNQGDLYFAFRQYLVTEEGAEYYKKIKSDEVSNLAFRIFRRHFARMALWEPCRPEQATIILETLNDADLYNDYFVRMFDRWYEKQETRTTIQKLPVLYQKFRELPGAVPAMPVFRGMFKVNFPKNTPRLEELRQDWIRTKGGLNRWGYEKFMKLYASQGDVQKTRDLWNQYAAEFPEMLNTPRGFRNPLNACSQAGDVEGAWAELEKMTDEYGVRPDIDSWNTVLKAYMRVSDYEGVMKCFDEISKHHQPDSFTYAHIMAMSAKKGDLDTTLEFLSRSQQIGMPISKEMALALVVVYCQNNLLSEAESLCIELTERKLTHSAIWNQLLNFYGVEGKIDKVYDLLRRMREFNVEWDDETYGFLLQALVKVNQIHPAYSLLKRADEEQLFLVTPEHFAIVMAGAARVGEFELVETIHARLQKSEMPVTFGALVALVSAAAKRKPGEERTKNLANEFVEHFRKAVEASKTAGRHATIAGGNSDAGNVARLREESQHVGRAIALLVELRELGSAEELMGLFAQVFPEYRSQEQFPPTVMSALMLAHYKEEKYDEVMELWNKAWERTLAVSKKPSGEGILAGSEWDLSRILNVVLRVYREKEDAQGLSDSIDKVVGAGFKLTRAIWALAIRFLAELGRWERAMYWCETMLMPGWTGWNPQRSNKEKRELQNTRILKAPKNVVYRLQQDWLEKRKMAAWSEDISRQLSSVEEKYPRLHHAFTTSDIESMPATYIINGKEVSARDLDKVLQSMSYHELIKVKEALLKELAKEKKREQSLGITPEPRSPSDLKEWKSVLHSKVRRYAAMWAKRRREQAIQEQGADEVGEAKIEVKDLVPETPDQQAARERFSYWNDFWDRYDQRPHGDFRRKKTFSVRNHHGANTRGKMDRTKPPPLLREIIH